MFNLLKFPGSTQNQLFGSIYPHFIIYLMKPHAEKYEDKNSSKQNLHYLSLLGRGAAREGMSPVFVILI